VGLMSKSEWEWLRERLVRFGVESLSDAELMAIILRTGTVEENEN